MATAGRLASVVLMRARAWEADIANASLISDHACLDENILWGDMLKFIREQVELWKFQRTPLAQAIRQHTQEYFHGGSALTSFTQENKEKLVADFCQRVSLIYQSENPVLACRELLAEYMLLFAQLQVHCLKENEKAEMFYGENPYISGQLWRHIQESSDHHEELARYKWEDPELSPEDLVGIANTRCALYLYYVNGMNIVRNALGDESKDKDWFRPFVEAMLVNEEDHLRRKLDLPELVPGHLGALRYSVFLNYVVDGEQHPFFTWCREFPDSYLAGEGPTPKLRSATN